MNLALRYFVYRHFTCDGVLLYVGISGYPKERLTSHRISPWFTQIASVRVREHRTRDGALNAETAAILFEKPKFNKRYNLTRAANILRPRVLVHRSAAKVAA